MPRRGYAVTIAALLLLAQLLLGVTARALPVADASGHCPDCPTASASMMHGGHGTGGHHCGSELPAGGTHCGHHCASTSGGHCGAGASGALASSPLHAALVEGPPTWSSARDARLRASPLFDFLRPPN